MSNKLLISLISEQTIPNVQFLKWYANKYSNEGPFDLLFVSTEKMEASNKSEEIMNSLEVLGFNYEYHYIVSVDQNDLSDVIVQLKHFFEDYPHTSVVANITGGTKLMSLGVYQFVESLPESEVYYKPIDGDLEKILPEKEIYKDDFNLSIDEYLKAVGCDYLIEIQKQNSFEYVQLVRNEIARNTDVLKVFNCITEKNSDSSFNLEKQKMVSSSHYSIKDVEAAINLCKKLGINPEKIPLNIPKYILGGWYEEYVYFFIKEKYSLDEKDILQNLKIQTGVENEFDVVFMYQDKLHIIECKAFMQGKTVGKKISDALYKLISLREKLGRSVKLTLYTTESNISPQNRLRAIESEIEIINLR